jgi:hypothetical protein
MITRYALFEGSIRPNEEDAFRQAVLSDILPKWRAFPGALAVRVSFAVSRDDGAPAYPLILAISYPSLDAVEAALASPARAEGRAATEAVMARFFTGRIHHHVTTAHEYGPS